jgi:hypothetical protein
MGSKDANPLAHDDDCKAVLNARATIPEQYQQRQDPADARGDDHEQQYTCLAHNHLQSDRIPSDDWIASQAPLASVYRTLDTDCEHDRC